VAANLDQGEPSDRPIHAAHQAEISRLCARATLTSRTGPSDARVESSTQLPIALGQLVGRESLARYERILTELNSKERDLIVAALELRWPNRLIASVFAYPNARSARLACEAALLRLAVRLKERNEAERWDLPPTTDRAGRQAGVHSEFQVPRIVSLKDMNGTAPATNAARVLTTRGASRTRPRCAAVVESHCQWMIEAKRGSWSRRPPLGFHPSCRP